MNEQTVLHRIYRECIDAVNDVWRKVSFWSQASDIDLTQGETVQFRLDNLDLDSTNAKTLIENFIYDANEAHRYLQLQLDQLRDNLQSRMTTLRSRFENWRIVVGDDPALIRAYEQRLEEAERDIAALIKAVQDEVDRIQGILDGILDAASNDPLAKDILDKITALRNKTNNDNSSIRDDCIGPGFNPDVQAIAPDITQAILAQDKKIYTTGSKFWQYYYFKNDHVESSEDLYDLETVGYGDVIDLPYGSQVNIDYNSKLDICFVRGWLVLDSYDFNKTDIGELNLVNIFPKDSTIAFAPEYMDITFSNGFTVKVNSMIGSKKVVFAPKGQNQGYSIRWEGNYETDNQGRNIQAYVDGESTDFGDIIGSEVGGYSGSFDKISILFRGAYYDRGTGEEPAQIIQIDTSRIIVTGGLNTANSTIQTYCFARRMDGYGNEKVCLFCVPENTVISGPFMSQSDEPPMDGYYLLDNTSYGYEYCWITETTATVLETYYNIRVNVPNGYKIISVAYDQKTPPAVNGTETFSCAANLQTTLEDRIRLMETAINKFQNGYGDITPVLSFYQDEDNMDFYTQNDYEPVMRVGAYLDHVIPAERKKANTIPSVVLYYVGENNMHTLGAGTEIKINYNNGIYGGNNSKSYKKIYTIPQGTTITLKNARSKDNSMDVVGLVFPLYNPAYYDWNYSNNVSFNGAVLTMGIDSSNNNAAMINGSYDIPATINDSNHVDMDGLVGTVDDKIGVTIFVSPDLFYARPLFISKTK